MKTISFTNNSKDVTALTKQVMKNSQASKQFRWFPYAAVLLSVITVIINGIREGVGIGTTIAMAVLLGLILLLLVRVLLWIAHRVMIFVTSYLSNKGQAKDFAGEHHIHLLDAQLQEESKMGMTSIYYEGLYRIDETPNHLFIFTSDSAAHAIPKKQLEPEQFDDFKAHLREKLPPEVVYTEFK